MTLAYQLTPTSGEPLVAARLSTELGREIDSRLAATAELAERLRLISALVPERFVVTLISRLFASASDIESIALIIRFRKTCCS